MNLSRLLQRAQKLGIVEADPTAVAPGGVLWDDLVLRVRQQILDEAVPEQATFILDRSQWTLALCSRQAGKGWSVARMLILRAMEEPNVVCLYVRRTLGLAKTTMWLQEPNDGIPAVLRQLGLEEGTHYTLNLSTTEARLANGSIIRLEGHERRIGWTDVRGHKFVLMVLDEMQEQEDEGLRQALRADIPYCFMRYTGRFVGIGTPGEFPVGPFYDICEDVPDPETGVGQRTGWSLHRWTAEALRHKTPVWDGMVAWKTNFNIPDTNPKWRRDGKGEWATDEQTLMLPLTPLGLWDGETLPPLIPASDGSLVPRTLAPTCYGGLDFGFTGDPAAIVVISHSAEEGIIRHAYGSKHPHLNTQQLADVIRRVMKEFGVVRFYADSADPKTIEDLRTLYKLPIVPAEKHVKEPWIQEMRAWLIDGRLQIIEGSSLHEELQVLSPDPEQLKRRRLTAMPGSVDHEYDALRYAYRGIRTRHVKAPGPPIPEDQRREQELFKQALASTQRPDDGRPRTVANRRR